MGLSLITAPVSPPRPADGYSAQTQYELPHLEVHRRSPLRFNRRFTFDRFVVGAANQYAYSASKALAHGRELNTDSLYLLADSGLGKSHLSQAIGHHVLASNARSNVFYLTAEDFTNEMIYSLKNKCIEDFKNKYRRRCDVLVLEEVHFLSGKEKVQAELSYTLDCLVEGGKKIVFTSARRPKDIPRLARTFASRLANSLISTIEPPDYATRLQIIEKKAEEHKLTAPKNVLELIADRLKKDVRQMESCLCSLSAKSRLLNRPIDVELAEESLADLVERRAGVDIEEIIGLICRHYQVTLDDLRSRSRKRNLVLPRNMGMYLSRTMTDLSLQAIGKHFGRNHSTVLYSINDIENRCRRDPKLKGQLEFLSEVLRQSFGD